jgi:hypothetical protein
VANGQLQRRVARLYSSAGNEANRNVDGRLEGNGAGYDLRHING